MLILQTRDGHLHVTRRTGGRLTVRPDEMTGYVLACRSLEERFPRLRFGLRTLLTLLQQFLAGLAVVDQTGVGVNLENVVGNQTITDRTTFALADRNRRENRVRLEELHGRLARRTLLGKELINPPLAGIGLLRAKRYED